jgi:hypothetical protein
MTIDPKVDEVLNDITWTELTAFTRWMLGRVPADLREEFIRKLVSPAALALLAEGSEESPKDLEREVRKILRTLKKGDRCLDSEYKEEWMKICHDDPGYDFIDYEGLLSDIKKAMRLLLECVHNKEFELGKDLSEMLLSLNVMVFGACYDDSPLNFYDLYTYYVLKDSGTTAKNMVIPAMFLCYYMSAPDTGSRLDAFLNFKNLLKETRTIYPKEMISLSGASIPDFYLFLAACIDCLVKQMEGKADDPEIPLILKRLICCWNQMQVNRYQRWRTLIQVL